MEAVITNEVVPMKLGERLVAKGLLSARDLERALLAQREMGGYLGQVLVRLGLVAEGQFHQVLAEHLGVELVTGGAAFPDEALDVHPLPLEFLINNRIVPLRQSEALWVFASAEPQSDFAKKALHLGTGKPVELVLATEADINAALEVYQESDESTEDDQVNLYTNDEEFVEHLKDLASEAPVIQRVNQMIQRALDLNASDIHLESFDDGLHLRYRIDGVLHDAEQPADPTMAAAVISRVKLLANLNIAERRLPQDGRIMMRVKGHELDLRVSTLPTVHGEGVVMRVLDRQSIRLDLSDMGFSDDILARFKSLLSRPHGVLLLTGPTGSGKTTTLYAAMSNMDAASRKIITVEDPVEYQLHGINQIPVQPQIDLTFARALRAILRQDPDIIMIGEMRDTETAQIAVQSALTGHLVLSTLHTNTAAAAITRLEDMGIERFLITAAVNGALSQRLIRKLCEACKRSVELSDEVLAESGLDRFLPAGERSVFEPVGCAECKNTGFRGRVAIHELFTLDSAAQKVVLAGADANQLHEHARSHGMHTLYEDGLRKVALGLSSLEEVLRVTQDQSEVADADAGES